MIITGEERVGRNIEASVKEISRNKNTWFTKNNNFNNLLTFLEYSLVTVGRIAKRCLQGYILPVVYEALKRVSLGVFVYVNRMLKYQSLLVNAIVGSWTKREKKCYLIIHMYKQSSNELDNNWSFLLIDNLYCFLNDSAKRWMPKLLWNCCFRQISKLSWIFRVLF